MTELEIQNITDYNSRYTILSVKAQAVSLFIMWKYGNSFWSKVDQDGKYINKDKQCAQSYGCIFH